MTDSFSNTLVAFLARLLRMSIYLFLIIAFLWIFAANKGITIPPHASRMLSIALLLLLAGSLTAVYGEHYHRRHIASGTYFTGFRCMVQVVVAQAFSILTAIALFAAARSVAIEAFSITDTPIPEDFAKYSSRLGILIFVGMTPAYYILANIVIHRIIEHWVPRTIPFGKNLLRPRNLAFAMAICICLGVGLFIWPSLYRYERLIENGNDYPARINRITGTAHILYPSGWREAGASDYDADGFSVLHYDQLSRITGRAGPQSGGRYDRFEATLYNGTNLTVKDIAIELRVPRTTFGDSIVRQYQFSDSIPPLSTRTVDCELGYRIARQDTWSWNIVSARGR